MALNDKKLLFAILEHLTSPAVRTSAVDAESLEVACQCLGEAFGIDVHSEEEKKQFGCGQTLKEIFDKAVPANPLFQSFVAKLEQAGFFKGVEKGSAQYYERLAAAKQKFDAKYKTGLGSPSNAPAPAPVGEPPAPEPVSVKAPSAEEKKEAEVLKAEANKLLSQGKLDEAIASYSKAIEKDGTNCVYYSNRGVANFKKGDFAASIVDNKLALQADPKYTKAWYRLGKAYAASNEHVDAVTAFESALKLAGDEAQMAAEINSQLQLSKQQLSGAGPDLSGMDINDILKDPAKIQSAMQNPQVQELLKNPAIMSMASQFLGGMGGMGANAPQPEAKAPPQQPQQPQQPAPAPGPGQGAPDLGGLDLSALMNNPAMMQMAQGFMQNMMKGQGGPGGPGPANN